MIRIRALLLLLIFLFGAYGLKEIIEALRYGTSTADGWESLLVAALMSVILFGLIKVEQWRAKTARAPTVTEDREVFARRIDDD